MVVGCEKLNISIISLDGLDFVTDGPLVWASWEGVVVALLVCSGWTGFAACDASI